MCGILYRSIEVCGIPKCSGKYRSKSTFVMCPCKLTSRSKIMLSVHHYFRSRCSTTVPTCVDYVVDSVCVSDNVGRAMLPSVSDDVGRAMLPSIPCHLRMPVARPTDLFS